MRKVFGGWLVLMALFVLVGQAAGAIDPATPLKGNQTVQFTLDKAEKKDYVIALPKGDFYVVLDMRREEVSNIQPVVQLLKNNGVLVQDRLVAANEIGRTARVISKLHLAKPLAARLRITHPQDVPVELWLTVVPAASMHLLPYGFGGEFKPLSIGVDKGQGGTFEKTGDAVYYKVALPAGKWSISLGLKRKEGGNLQASVDMLTVYGAVDKKLFYVNEIGTEARKEGIVTITKPRTVYVRVVVDNSNMPDYDVTVEKATE